MCISIHDVLCSTLAIKRASYPGWDSGLTATAAVTGGDLHVPLSEYLLHLLNAIALALNTEMRTLQDTSCVCFTHHKFNLHLIHSFEGTIQNKAQECSDLRS